MVPKPLGLMPCESPTVVVPWGHSVTDPADNEPVAMMGATMGSAPSHCPMLGTQLPLPLASHVVLAHSAAGGGQGSWESASRAAHHGKPRELDVCAVRMGHAGAHVGGESTYNVCDST